MNHRFGILIGLIGLAGFAFSHINWTKNLKAVKNVTYAEGNVIIIIYLTFLTIDRVSFNTLSSITIIGLFSLFLTLVIYFKGSIYRVADYPDVKMLPLIFSALDASELHNYKQDPSEEDTLITLKIRGSSKVLTLQTKREFFSGQSYYLLRFKYWMHLKSKKSILAHIKSALEQHPQIHQKSWTLTVEKSLTIALILIVILYGNALIVKPYKIALNYEGFLPEKLMITRLDRRITEVKQNELIEVDNPKDIALFYETLHDVYNYSEEDVVYNDIASEDHMMEYTYTVKLDKPWRTLFVGPYKVYATVDYEEMKKASIWHEISVSVYQFLGGEDYAIYLIYSDENLKSVLDGILE